MSSCTDLRIDLADAARRLSATASLRARLRDSARHARAGSRALSRYVAAQIALRDHRRDVAVEACVERLLASEGRVPLAELWRARRPRRAPAAAPLRRGRRHLAAHARRRRPAAPGLRSAARRAVVDLVRARPGGRLLRPPADGARLPSPARHRTDALGGGARPGLATSLADSAGLEVRQLSQSYKAGAPVLTILVAW